MHLFASWTNERVSLQACSRAAAFSVTLQNSDVVIHNRTSPRLR